MINNDSQFETKLKYIVSEGVKQLEDEGEKNPGFYIKFEQEKKSKWKNKFHFIKVYDSMFDMIDQYKLDAYELATTMRLMEFVEYETNLIAYKGVALNKKDLIEILDYSENKLDDILRNLVEKKVLAKTKVGRKLIYHMNPLIAFRGEYLSPETESIFRDLDNNE